MPNFQNQLKKILQSHQKGIQDLIGQEMTINLYAHFLVEHPERESEIEIIFENIYKNTYKNLENLFLEFYQNTQEKWSEEEMHSFKQTLQEFVHLQVAQTRQKLWDKVSWLERRM
jgi:hypothetical protein